MGKINFELLLILYMKVNSKLITDTKVEVQTIKCPKLNVVEIFLLI